MIALKNSAPVYNGMRGIVRGDAIEGDTIQGKAWHLHCKIDFPDEKLPVAPHVLCAAQINREKVFADVEELRARGIDVRSMGMAGESRFTTSAIALLCTARRDPRSATRSSIAT